MGQYPGDEASNDSVIVVNGNFQRFLCLFLRKLWRRGQRYSDMQSVVSFSVIPKRMTLNDLEWLFRVKFCFRAGLAGSDRATFEK